jgi:hypothetical protein
MDWFKNHLSKHYYCTLYSFTWEHVVDENTIPGNQSTARLELGRMCKLGTWENVQAQYQVGKKSRHGITLGVYGAAQRKEKLWHQKSGCTRSLSIP